MTIVAFAGPSLPKAERAPYPDVDWRPPAEAGDLLRLAASRPETVCLIDGYFDHRPAVRHKEILLLLAAGTRVYGASSIGALRAAEMHSFGMVGVGAIFRAYARGTIEGDDEVALIHASADFDWRAVSVPLVDVRATLCRAMRFGIIEWPAARAVLEVAVGLHYVERDWAAILAAASHEGISGLGAWLRTGAVPQKRLDAHACIRAAEIGSGRSDGRPAFVWTAFVDALALECRVTLTPSREKPRPDSLPHGSSGGGAFVIQK